jgi:hypothetical protein
MRPPLLWVLIVGALATTVLLVLFFLLPSASTPGPTPVGGQPPLIVGNPVPTACPATGSFATTGCTAGDFTYDITIEEASISFGEVAFEVTTSNGMLDRAIGGTPGFSILNSTGAPVAQSAATAGEMSMTEGWSYHGGVSGSTSLTNLCSVTVDMGTVDPRGLGYLLVVTLGPALGGAPVQLP